MLIAGHTVTLYLVDDTDTPIPLGGIESLSLVLSQPLKDTQIINDSPWRTLASATGNRSIRITASGLFDTHAAEESLRAHAFNATPAPLRFHFGNGDILAGDFMLTHFERTGDTLHTPAKFKYSAESTGEISYD